MSNSIWENPEVKQAEANESNNSGSPFINKMLNDGDSTTLQFTNLLHKDQDGSSMFPTADGKYWEFYFVDSKGKEKSINQNSVKGKFFQAMKKAGIEVLDVIKITKHMVETDFNGETKMIPNWDVQKVDGFSLMDETKELRDKKPTTEIPF